jgi:hypothetical protein
METDDGTYYFGEYGKFGCYGNDGVIYKNRDAFETGNGVCYIPEFGFDNNDENGSTFFEFYAKGGYTRADIEALCEETNFDAEDFFEHLDWMYPETLMNEWLDDEEEILC